MEYFRKKPNQNQGVPFSLFRGASVAERNLSGGCFGKEGHGRRAGEVPKSQAACLRRGRGDLDLRRKGTHAGAVWWWEGYILPKPLKGPPRQSGAAREEQGRVEQNFFPVPLARTAERRQTSITSSRNTKGDAPMGIAFWWWEGYILPKPLRGPLGKAARHERSRAGLSKISFLCRLPELPNVGRPQLPLPVTQKAMPRWVSPFGGGKR